MLRTTESFRKSTLMVLLSRLKDGLVVPCRNCNLPRPFFFYSKKQSASWRTVSEKCDKQDSRLSSQEVCHDCEQSSRDECDDERHNSIDNPIFRLCCFLFVSA